jgi:hypothetical protein
MIISFKTPLQLFPPFSALVPIVRFRDWTPLPQVALQLVQPAQA